ncbi:hypothetical protein SELMODRAFT_120018 [Selaginella moellendorffii]|uniref:PHD-type zinc finger plants domain-containing protein n=1 Tax=Selaginella moellendorffii TaxID=88036 RepID=D8SLH5_SELML|nr:hypothetical protein SELMODRAFT_120018 [Selaginella moellendorffii]
MEGGIGKKFSAGARECTMCGDVGFSTELFPCDGCQRRYQHRYCSDLYPKDPNPRLCNWCLHERKKTSSNFMADHGIFMTGHKRKVPSFSSDGTAAQSIDSGVSRQGNNRIVANGRIQSLPPRSCNHVRGIAKRYKLLSQVSC